MNVAMACIRVLGAVLLMGTGLVGGLGCSAAESKSSPRAPTEGEPEGPAFFESEGAGASTSSGTSSGSSSVNGLVDGTSDEPTSSTAPNATCATYQEAAELVKQPVDIIVLLDNSGSMEDEAASVEANINVNFASVLANSAVDYRVILISRHRTGARDSSGPASTSVCVQAPLSGLENCDDAPEPVFSDRFFQYSTKIESDDSFDVALDTYEPPFDKSYEEKYDHAPLGWSAWLRPGAKKVFLEVTDDDEDMPATDFVSALLQMAPEHFGTDPAHPAFVFHSIVGLAEKDPVTAAYLPDEPVQKNKCTGNNGDVTSSGETYQDLSRLTGGLRFPLCQYDAYDVVFQRIAEDVALRRGITCDFEIPAAPQGSELNLNNVALSYTPGGGSTAVQFGQAPSIDTCQDSAFYIAGGRLNLCPAACTQVQSDPMAALSVLFTCESQLIIPR
jgi:hypothetical protein